MKRSEGEPRRPVRRLLPWLAMLTAVGLVAYYILFPSWGYFHADCTDTLLWAQASCDSGSLFSRDFSYACLLPFGGQLLMLPWVALFGVSTAAQSLGMLLFLLLFTAALIGLCRSLGWDWGWTAVTTASMLLLLSVSEKLREIFWSHIIYYSLGVLFLLVGLTLLSSLLREEEDCGGAEPVRRRWLPLGACLLWFFLCSLNGLQAMALFAVPLLAGLVGERYLDTAADLRTGNTRRTAQLALLLTAAVLCGFGTGKWLTRGLDQTYFDGYSGFSSPDQWVGNLLRLLPNWLTLLGADPKMYAPLVDGTGLLNLLRIVVGLVLAAVPAAAVCCYRRIQERMARILLLAHWCLAALLLFANIFGLLADANWRLSPLVASSLLITVLFSRWLWMRRPLRRFALLSLAPVLLLCTVSALLLAEMSPHYGQDDGYPALARYLEEQDLSYGYATFWNSNVITVLSDSRVRVCPVNFDGAGCTPSAYQSSSRWYEPQPEPERYFLLLTEEEYGAAGGTANPLIASALEEETFEGYRIEVLPACPFG